MASCASPITHPDSATLWGLAEGLGARRVALVISGVGQRPEKAGYGLLPLYGLLPCNWAGRTLPHILATSEARKGSSGDWQGSGTRRRRHRAGFLGPGSDGLLGLSLGVRQPVVDQTLQVRWWPLLLVARSRVGPVCAASGTGFTALAHG
jgi:hypothetical protein